MTVQIPIQVLVTPTGRHTCVQLDPIMLCPWFTGAVCTFGDLAVKLSTREIRGFEYPIPYESCPIKRAMEMK